jgi:hypothetical protein
MQMAQESPFVQPAHSRWHDDHNKLGKFQNMVLRSSGKLPGVYN